MNFGMSVAVIQLSPSLQAVAASDFGVSVTQVQFGLYTVTFPEGIRIAGCVATPNSGEGMITAVPGVNTGLSPNQVSVATFDASGSFTGGMPYTLVVFYPAR